MLRRFAADTSWVTVSTFISMTGSSIVSGSGAVSFLVGSVSLKPARFDRLHHGVQALGIVCHDLLAGEPRYFGTGFEQGVGLHEAVRASASIPRLFPAGPQSPAAGRAPFDGRRG